MTDRDHALLRRLCSRETVVGALRYYMGRHTIAVHGWCQDVSACLDVLDEGTRGVMARDIRGWLDGLPDGRCECGGVDDAAPFRMLLEELGASDGRD